MQADALGDLNTKSNKLSVWRVEDDRSNLERILAALAASVDVLANLDYAVFDDQMLSDLAMGVERTMGKSPDDEVNLTWHQDLTELTAQKLVNLAVAIQGSAEIDRIPELRARELILLGVESGSIDSRKLREGIRLKLGLA